jgi:hypothetical protein
VQGLFSDHDCEEIPELPGVWTSPSETFSIQKIEGNRYRMIEQEIDSQTGNKLALDMCVAHVAGYRFYDSTFQLLAPDDKPTLPPEFVVGNAFAFDILAGYWQPMHMFGRLEIEKNVLRLRGLDNDWLQHALKSRRVMVASTQNDDGEYFLTARGKELKAFVARIAADPKAFSIQEDLTRVPVEKPTGTR